MYSYLLINLATYSLSDKSYYFFALKCLNLNDEISNSVHNLTNIINSKILREVIYYKLQNNKYDKENLKSLLQTYLLVGWNNKYKEFIKFVEENGIEIDE